MGDYFSSSNQKEYFADDSTRITIKKREEKIAVGQMDAISSAKSDFEKRLEVYATTSHKVTKRRYAIK